MLVVASALVLTGLQRQTQGARVGEGNLFASAEGGVDSHDDILDGTKDGSEMSIGSVRCAPPPASTVLVSVKDAKYGAKGDGKTNDTLALQKAVDAVAGTGGTVLVPPGRYLVDAAIGVRLGSKMTLSLAAGATLKALPNALGYYHIVFAVGVEQLNIVGFGAIIEGERYEHIGVGGEWGLGLELKNVKKVVVEGITARECWGDGFYVGGELTAGVTLCSVTADDNRRQGLSVISVDGMIVRDSLFQNTAGVAPELGIDIEPDKGQRVNNVLISSCLILGNAGGGIQIGVAMVDMKTTFVTNVVAERNTIRGNGRGARPLSYGVQLASCSGNAIRDNRIESNRGAGLAAVYTTGSVITGNTVTGTKTGGSAAGVESGAGVVLNSDKGTTCTGNTVAGNAGHGILLRNSTTVSAANTIVGNGSFP